MRKNIKSQLTNFEGKKLIEYGCKKNVDEFIKNISKSSKYKRVKFITSDEKGLQGKSPKFSLSFNKIILFSADYAVCNSKKNNFIRKQVAERL